MDGSPPRLTIVDFLDVALLGTIVLLVGLALLPPVQSVSPSPGAGPVEQTLLSIVRTLGSVSGPVENLGFLLTIAGSGMVLIGPVWVLVGRPLFRRGYL